LDDKKIALSPVFETICCGPKGDIAIIEAIDTTVTSKDNAGASRQNRLLKNFRRDLSSVQVE
jgi:hypothetical protein